MIMKMVEIRDRHTCIPAVAIRMTADSDAQRYLMARVGFHGDGVILMRLNDQKATADTYGWGGSARTMPSAHMWIEAHFDEIADGDVVDVEFLKGESRAPKVSERITEAET